MTKVGKRLYEVIFGSYLWVFLSRVFCFYLSFHLCSFWHVVFGGHGHVFVTLQYLVDMYFVVCNLFWGWHELLYEHIYFLIFLLSLGSYVSLSFCWYMWYISSVCVVCGIFVLLVFPLETNHYYLFWRLLVGWRETICIYTTIIPYSLYA